MKGNYKLLSGRLTFEVVGNSAKEVWEQLGQIQELFEAETTCGLCGSADLRYVVRRAGQNKEYDFYELRCRNCPGRLDFGQSKDKVNLFPKRKEHAETRGWYIYDPNAPEKGEGVYYEEEEQAAPPPQRQPAPQQQRQAAPPPPQRQPAPQQQQRQAAPQQQQRQAPTAGSRHNASDLPYEVPPPRGGYR